MSSSAWLGGSSNDLYDNVTGDENATSVVDFRCVFVENTNATLSGTNGRVWIAAEVAGGTSIAISLDTTGVVSSTLATAQAKTIANETTAPATQTFVTTPVSKATGLVVATLPPANCFAIWIRRTAANTAALAADGFTVRYECDSL